MRSKRLPLSVLGKGRGEGRLPVARTSPEQKTRKGWPSKRDKRARFRDGGRSAIGAHILEIVLGGEVVMVSELVNVFKPEPIGVCAPIGRGVRGHPFGVPNLLGSSPLGRNRFHMGRLEVRPTYSLNMRHPGGHEVVNIRCAFCGERAGCYHKQEGCQ